MDGTRKYSFETGRIPSFGAVDYILFLATLCVTIGIAIYYAIKHRNDKTTKSYFLAGGNMPVTPASLSLVAGFTSAITFLGIPTEGYNFNSMFMDLTLSYIVSFFLAAYVYLPILYKLEITTIYEYLERRFCRGMRLVGSISYCILMIMYMAIVLYGPALALNVVTGFNVWGAVVIFGVVCIIYTSLGGMKAIMMSDSFQAITMIFGLLIVLVEGSDVVGGFANALKIASDNKRVRFAEVSLDPRVRYTVWGFLFGGSILWTSVYVANQAQAQRLFSLPTVKKTQKVIWLHFTYLLFILYISGLIGIVVYSLYSKCDPITYGLIKESDQIAPLFLMDTLSHLKGFPGIFFASIISAGLSSMGAGINSITAVILEDFLKPYYLKDVSDEKATIVSKALSPCIGVLCLVLTYAASKLGGILQATLALFGCLSAPILGVFSLGMFFPWSNKWGAYSGTFTSILMMMWVSLGNYASSIPPARTPISVEKCNWNLTLGHSHSLEQFSIANKTAEYIYPTGIEGFYSISYLWYNFFAVIIVLLVGVIVSFATGPEDPKKVDPKLICPIFDILCPCMSESTRKKLRFGVIHKNKYGDESATTPARQQTDGPKAENLELFENGDPDKPIDREAMKEFLLKNAEITFNSRKSI